MQLVSVAVPRLLDAAAVDVSAELPLTVQLVSVSVPSLKMPPP